MGKPLTSLFFILFIFIGVAYLGHWYLSAINAPFFFSLTLFALLAVSALALILLRDASILTKPGAGPTKAQLRKQKRNAEKWAKENHIQTLSPRINRVDAGPNDILQARPKRETAKAPPQKIVQVRGQLKRNDSRSTSIAKRSEVSRYRAPKVSDKFKFSKERIDRIHSLGPEDLLREHRRYVRDLDQILIDSSSRIQNLEHAMIDNLLAANGQFINAVVDARRITTALQTRFQTLEAMLVNTEPGDPLAARDLMRKPLEIPKDTVNSLLDAKEVPPIPAYELEAALDTLLGSAEEQLQRFNAERVHKVNHSN